MQSLSNSQPDLTRQEHIDIKDSLVLSTFGSGVSEMAEVREFLTCPICLDTFTNPTSLSCHHSFCRSCLLQHWDQDSRRNCPVCYKRSSKEFPGVNFALRELSNSLRHQLRLSDPSEQQRVPAQTEERTEERREKVQDPESLLKALREQRDQVRARVDLYENMVQHSEEQAVYCERQITAVFERIQRHLQEEQERAMSALREEQRRQAVCLGPQLQRFRDQLLSLNRSLEELQKQLETHTYHTALTLQPLPPPPTGLLLNQAKVLGNLGFRVWSSLRRAVQFNPIVLDPNTANPWLLLSEDLSRVRCGDTVQQLPDGPERFIMYPIVLGSEGYSSGTHQWDLEVGDLPEWSIGVAKDPVDRKGELLVSPEFGLWCLRHGDGHYKNGAGKTLRVEKPPERIRVKLDCDRGRVSFYDADHMTHLYTYSGNFTENMFPYICVCQSGDARTKEICICPTSGPQ